VSQDSLKKMNKHFNSLERHKELVRKLHERNIAIMGALSSV